MKEVLEMSISNIFLAIKLDLNCFKIHVYYLFSNGGTGSLENQDSHSPNNTTFHPPWLTDEPNSADPDLAAIKVENCDNKSEINHKSEFNVNSLLFQPKSMVNLPNQQTEHNSEHQIKWSGEIANAHNNVNNEMIPVEMDQFNNSQGVYMSPSSFPPQFGYSPPPLVPFQIPPQIYQVPSPSQPFVMPPMFTDIKPSMNESVEVKNFKLCSL